MKILFLCVANSARSQMAEGLAKSILGDSHEIRSAGSVPAKMVNPFAVRVLSEIGIDISGHRPKTWDDLPPAFFINLDYVITLCAEEVCPTMVSKAQKIHWPFTDPASKEPLADAEMLKRFREARGAIQARLKDFKREIGQ